MRVFEDFLDQQVIDALHCGRVGVMPTDTLYGILGRAQEEEVVERVYGIKERDSRKPLIVLISSLDDLKIFGASTPAIVKSNWPGEISIILSVKGFSHLHRGKGRVAFRMPRHKELRELISITGPLIAPSANREGEDPARSAKEAIEIFGERVDFYVDRGEVEGLPSTLIEVKKERIIVLREGAIKKEMIR